MTRTLMWAVLVTAAIAGAIGWAASDRSQLPQRLPAACDAAELDCVWTLLGAQPGQTVAELGAGDGTLALGLARRLGPTGSLLATEVDPEKIEAIRKAAAEAKQTNLRVVTGGDRITGLPAGCCDAAYMRFVYHHFVAPEDIGRDLHAALKPGGMLVVIDFPPSRLLSLFSRLPSSKRRGGHGVRPTEVATELTAAGFRVVLESSYSFGSLSPFVVVFHKPAG